MYHHNVLFPALTDSEKIRTTVTCVSVKILNVLPWLVSMPTVRLVCSKIHEAVTPVPVETHRTRYVHQSDAQHPVHLGMPEILISARPASVSNLLSASLYLQTVDSPTVLEVSSLILRDVKHVSAGLTLTKTANHRDALSLPSADMVSSNHQWTTVRSVPAMNSLLAARSYPQAVTYSTALEATSQISVDVHSASVPCSRVRHVPRLPAPRDVHSVTSKISEAVWCASAINRYKG